MSISNVLYSRSEFLENVNDFLESHALSDWCIISIDIERFKLFNNWYGQEAGDILLTNISQYLLRIQQMKGYLAGYFGGDHFFMCIPDDDQLINLIYKTIRSYIGIHSQNEGFLPIIGIYSIPDDHPDVATMCNNAQLAGSDIKGNFNKRISYFTDEIINQLEKEQQAAAETDEKRKAELLKIAEVNRHVPEFPARNLYEAMQSLLTYEYACFMEQNASSYNLGRLDQYFYPYYKADKEAGIITDDEAQELFDCLWIKIAEMSLFQDEITAQYAAGYCITVQTSCGGINEYGDDATNELSYMMIQATMDVKFKEPNLAVTYSMAKNPDALLHKAVESISMGLTMPAIYANDVGIRMIMNKGIPLSEAWDWNPCGCVETNVSGKLKEYTDIADINMGAMVEFALNDGKSRITGEQVSVHTGDPRAFKTFEEFLQAVKKHIDHAVDVITSGNQLLDYLSMNYRPVPVLSMGFPHTMEVGKDYSQPGGAKYSVGGGVITVGQADIINSVAAVKYLVFDEKKCTMDELIKALDADFVGYEDIQKMCLDAPKYGNDDERADFCVGEIFSHVVDQFETYETAFGKMTCGMLPVSGNTPIGQWVGALPSGRNAKTPLTDGIGATGGTDINGPTALLKSVSRIPHARYTQGTQLNMKFEPEMLKGESGIAHGMNMIKTMSMLDVYHAQINCVDRDTLIDAQVNPKEHRDLLIRVAGYTAFFVELSKETQDEIIGRTEINNWSGGCGC